MHSDIGTARTLAVTCLTLAACTATTVDAPPPLAVNQGGNNQWAPPSSPLPAAIGVQLILAGEPQAGVTISFTTSAGTITPATVNTEANGVAAATWTLPAGATPRFVRATAHINRLEAPDVVYTAFVVPAENAVVTVSNNIFSPVPRTIAAGQTVTWLWLDGAIGHNVNPLGLEPLASGALRDGPFVYSYAFPTSGNYTFYCEAHGTPAGTGMAGVITVQAPT